MSAPVTASASMTASLHSAVPTEVGDTKLRRPQRRTPEDKWRRERQTTREAQIRCTSPLQDFRRVQLFYFLDQSTISLGVFVEIVVFGPNVSSGYRFSSRRAASVIRCGPQTGSQTTSTAASVTASRSSVFTLTSLGRDCAAGQFGEVSVMMTFTALFSWTLTS